MLFTTLIELDVVKWNHKLLQNHRIILVPTKKCENSIINYTFFCNSCICILPSFYGLQNGWSTMQYPKVQESTTYWNIIQSQRDQCWNWTLINEMAKCRGPMYYKCPCWPDSVQALTKQKSQKAFGMLQFFFEIAALLTSVFSSATLFLVKTVVIFGAS